MKEEEEEEDSLSSFLMSRDEETTAATNTPFSSTTSTSTAAAAIFSEGRLNLIIALNNNHFLLNWGPNFERLVGVCIEIAQLPGETTIERDRHPAEPHQSRTLRGYSASPSTGGQVWKNPRSSSNPQFKDRRRSPVSPPPPPPSSSQNWNFRSNSNPQFHQMNSKWPTTKSPDRLRDAAAQVSSRHSPQRPDTFVTTNRSRNPQTVCSTMDENWSGRPSSRPTPKSPSSRPTPKSPSSRPTPKSPSSRPTPKSPSPRIGFQVGQNFPLSSSRHPEDDDLHRFQKLDCKADVEDIKEEYV